MQGIVDQLEAHPEEAPVMLGNNTYTTPTDTLKDMVKTINAAGKKVMPRLQKYTEESEENQDTLKMKLR